MAPLFQATSLGVCREHLQCKSQPLPAQNLRAQLACAHVRFHSQQMEGLLGHLHHQHMLCLRPWPCSPACLLWSCSLFHTEPLPQVQSICSVAGVTAGCSLQQMSADWGLEEHKADEQPVVEAACLGDLADGKTKDVLAVHCNVVKGSHAGGMRTAERLGVVSARKVTLQAAVWAAVRKVRTC